MVEVVNQTEWDLVVRRSGIGGPVGEVSRGSSITFGEPCETGTVTVWAEAGRRGLSDVSGSAKLVRGEMGRIVLRY